jgi:hypothetical protein
VARRPVEDQTAALSSDPALRGHSAFCPGEVVDWLCSDVWWGGVGVGEGRGRPCFAVAAMPLSRGTKKAREVASGRGEGRGGEARREISVGKLRGKRNCGLTCRASDDGINRYWI